MKTTKVLYPVGGFPKDEFGFPHYEAIQKTNQQFKKFYINELEQRKIKHRLARGALFSKQWKAQTAKASRSLLKLLN